MKIKRFDNLWLMGLILSASILGVIYFLKICFPSFVVEVAQIDSITRIGHYIDTHKWAWYLASAIFSFFVYYFYCGACCSIKRFNYRQILIIISAIFILFGINEFLPEIYTVCNYISLLILPLIFNGKFKNTVICFSSINLLQILTVQIRGIINLISHYNFATLTILMIDVYILEVLLYLMFNYKKEK